jgi:hypothetical protein
MVLHMYRKLGATAQSTTELGSYLEARSCTQQERMESARDVQIDTLTEDNFLTLAVSQTMDFGT